MRSAALLFCTLMLMLVYASAAPAAQARGPAMDGNEHRVVDAVNWIRGSYRLPALKRSRSLNRAADYHSREMLAANYFAHSSRNGGSFSSRVQAFRRSRRVGETLAMVSRCSRRAARQAVKMWMYSPTHRDVLLSSRYRRIGVGMRAGQIGSRRACMVTADLASRR